MRPKTDAYTAKSSTSRAAPAAQSSTKKPSKAKPQKANDIEKEIARLAEEERKTAAKAKKGDSSQKTAKPASVGKSPGKAIVPDPVRGEDRTQESEAARIKRLANAPQKVQANTPSAPAPTKPDRISSAAYDRMNAKLDSMDAQEKQRSTDRLNHKINDARQARVEAKLEALEVRATSVPPAAGPAHASRKSSPSSIDGGLLGHMSAAFAEAADGALKTVTDGLSNTANFARSIPGSVVRAGDAIRDTMADGVRFIVDKSGESLGKAVDAEPRINELRETGDRVTIAIGGSGKAASVIPGYTPFPVGARVEYSYSATITQIAPAPGTTAPRYEVAYSKNLLGVGTADWSPKKGPQADGTVSVGFGVEVGAGASDTTIMIHGSKAEAKDALKALGQISAAETVRDIGQTLSLTWPPANIFQNPLRGGGGDPPPNAIPTGLSSLALAPVRSFTNFIADKLEPTKADRQFLEDHVAGYRQTTNLHLRGAANAWIHMDGKPVAAALPPQAGPVADTLAESLTLSGGVMPFVDVMTPVTREVMLPRDGNPGTLSYSASRSVALREADLAMLSLKGGGPSGASVTPYAMPALVSDIGKVANGAAVTWNLSDQQARDLKTSRGMNLPELSMLAPGNDASPDQAQVRSELTIPALGQPLKKILGSKEPDHEILALTTRIDNVGHHLHEIAMKGIPAVATGGLPAVARGVSAIAGAIRDSQVAGDYRYVERDGFVSWNEVGLSGSTGGGTAFSAYGAGIVKALTEKIVQSSHWETPDHTPPRQQSTAGSSGSSPPVKPPLDPDDALTPQKQRPIRRHAPAPSPITPPPPRALNPLDYEPPGTGARSEQLVVVPREGLNLRTAPRADAPKGTPLSHGTFVQTTGHEVVRSNGERWVEVHGPGVDRQAQRGWVAKEFTTPHPKGSEGPQGRVDWSLRALGYHPIAVKPGDTVRDIAAAYGIDPSRAVAVNRDHHIIDPDLVFPEDTVYLPTRPEAIQSDKDDDQAPSVPR